MKSPLYYYILSGLFVAIALFTLSLSSITAIMQNSAWHPPIKLLHAEHPINRFLLSFPKQKQKNYFIRRTDLRCYLRLLSRDRYPSL